MSDVSEAGVVAALAAAVSAAGGQAQWAAKSGIAQSVVSETLRGIRRPSEAVANALGFVEMPKTYRKLSKGAA